MFELKLLKSRPRPKLNKGEIVIYNVKGNFGDENDEIFQIHSRRYGTCNAVPKKQWWYTGVVLRVNGYESEGTPKVPVYSTTLSNASENDLRRIDKDLTKRL